MRTTHAQNFFRIQGPDGRGPYGSKPVNIFAQMDFQTELERHPAPKLDSKLCDSFQKKTNRHLQDFSDYVFGFTSIAQLSAWFYSYSIIEWLAGHGFVLLVSDVEIIEGNAQALALKSDLKKADCTIFSLMDVLNWTKD